MERGKEREICVAVAQSEMYLGSSNTGKSSRGYSKTQSLGGGE